MFSKTERYHVAGLDPNAFFGQMSAILHQYNIPTMTPYQGALTGTGMTIGSHVKPKVDVTTVAGHDGGVYIDFKISAQFDQNNMLLVWVLMMFFWPVGLILAYQAHQTFQTCAVQLLAAMRGALGPNAQPVGHAR